MSKLRSPLRSELSDTPTEHSIKATWDAVQRRRARERGRAQVRRGAAMALSAAVTVCALLLWLWRPAPSAEQLTVAGQPFASLATTAPLTVDLSDGSRLELGARTRLEVLENSPRSLGTALRYGSVVFDVNPGGARHWVIEAGLATVEVVGTKFTVSRASHSVEVFVERGIVVVRGEHVPDRVRRLVAGESLHVIEPRFLPQVTPNEVTSVVPSVPQAPQRTSVVPSAPPAAVARSFDDLLVAADAQRRRGELMAAQASLKSALASAPDSKRAALAAFTLGKLQMDNLGSPGQAAASFARAVSLGPPAAIAEDALARLVEAEGRSGQLVKARDDAKKYLTQYPNGRRAYAVRQWLEQP